MFLNMSKITSSFFKDKTSFKLAKQLLGKELVHKSSTGVISGIINEVEVYIEEDEASHSHKGRKTSRNEAMFLSGGHSYIYFTYGMYYCLNITSGVQNKGEAVLIRSILPKEGIELMKKNRNYSKDNIKDLTNGPAKLTQALDLNLTHNKLKITDLKSKLYLQETVLEPKEILSSPRIGISKNKNKLWRYYVKEFK